MRVPKKRRRTISTPWWLLGAFIIALTIAAYLPAIHGGFIWDDDAHITKPELGSVHGLIQIWAKPGATQQYYPLVHSVFWIEHKLWDDSVVPYHLINILLHAICALILFKILLQLKVPGAWLVAALFALHPVQVESVAWISELKNTLSGAFFLSSALVYLSFDQTRNRIVYVASLALFLSGLLSKTVIAPLPAVLLIVLWWKRGRLSWPRDVLPLLPFFGLGIAAGLFTAWVEHHFVGAQGGDFNLSILDRCLIAGRDFWFYLFKLLWPEKLIFIYPRWQISQVVWQQYLFPAATLVLFALLWKMRTRWRGPLAALLFFLGLLFPSLGFVNVFPFIYSFVADHFQYLACIGPLTLVGAGITIGLDSFGPRNAFLRQLLCTLLLLTLGILTWRQSRQYADIETLWRTTIARNPACWMAYDNLGNVLLVKGQLEEATALFQKTLAIKSDYAEAQNSVGAVFVQQGRLAEAEAQFRKALQIQPDYAQAQNNLGAVFMQQGRLAEAEAQFRKALQIQPDYAQAQNNLGNLLLQQGQLDEAIPHLEKALAAKPDYAEAYISLGVILGQKGELDQAIAEFNEALRLKPDYAEAHTNLGNALASQRKFDQALPHYMEALRLNPNSPETHYILGYTLLQLGRREEAVAHFTEALRLNPDYTEAKQQLRNLGVPVPP